MKFTLLFRFVLLPAVAVMAGGSLGRALRPEVPPRATPGSATTSPEKPGSHSPRGLRDRTRARIDAVHRAGSPSAQCLAVLSFAEAGTVAEIRDLLENVRFLPPHAAESLAIGALLRRWLELEPENAMEYCRARHPAVLADLLVNYAATHPAEAERLAGAVPGAYWSGLAWRHVCLAVAARDPDAAWAMLQRTPKNAEHDAARAVGKLAARDLAGAPARIGQLPEAIRGYAKGALAWEMMKADPATGWDWVRSQPDPFYLIQHTIGETLRRDPGGAFALLSSLPPEQLAGVRERWQLSFNLYDLADTSAALAASPLNSEVRQTLAGKFFFIAQQRDPAAALSLFSQMAPGNQLEKLPEFLIHWNAKDPAAAEAWRKALPEGPLREAASSQPEARNAEDAAPVSPAAAIAHELLVKGYFRSDDARLAGLTPDGVGEIMAVMPEGPQDYVIAGLARQNPGAVTGWLEASGEVTNRTGPRIARFFVQWAGESPAEAAAWTARQPEGDVARTAAVNVARQYQCYDPGAARAWVDSLPAGTVQEAARQGLTSP